MSRKTGRKLRIESLESRTVMAGNVLASYYDGALRINGDLSANNVLISTSRPNYVRVSPFDPVSSTPTRMNGTATAKEFYVPSGSVVVRLGGGADQVSVQGLTGTHLTIDTSLGGDTVWVENSWISKSVTISTGADSDSVIVDHLKTSSLSIATGDGFDSVLLADSAMLWLAIDGGTGWDQLRTKGGLPGYRSMVAGIESHVIY